MQATTIDPSVRHQQREDRAMLLLMAPALLVVVVLLVVPLAWLSWQSIYHDGAFTLVNYRRVFTGTYLDTFLMTFKLSIIVTGITLLLGYPVAYFAASVPPKWSALILGMVILPFWTSVLVRTYAWLVLLQRTGLVNKALLSMGLIDRPLQLSYNQFGTIVAMVHILARAPRSPHAFAFPAGLRVVDAAIHTLREEAERVRNTHHDELAVHERDQGIGSVSGDDGDILAKPQRVERVHPIVIM